MNLSFNWMPIWIARTRIIDFPNQRLRPPNNLLKIYIMTVKNAKVLINSVKISDVKAIISSYENSEELCLALFLLSFSLVWRAQIAALAKSNNLSQAETQGLSSETFIASKILTKDPLINKFSALLALFDTAFFDASQYEDKTDEEISNLLDQKANELASSSGTAKILIERQISSAESIDTHRRGIMIQRRGNWQSAPIFSPNEVIRNIGPAILSFSQFLESFSFLIKELGFPNSKETFIKCFTYLNIEDPSKEEINSLSYEELAAILIRYLILDRNSLTNLNFQDGLKISLESSSDPKKNFSPLELPFEEHISRSYPATAISAIKADSSSHPFLKAAISQQSSKGKSGKPAIPPSPKEKGKSAINPPSRQSPDNEIKASSAPAEEAPLNPLTLDEKTASAPTEGIADLAPKAKRAPSASRKNAARKRNS